MQDLPPGKYEMLALFEDGHREDIESALGVNENSHNFVKPPGSHFETQKALLGMVQNKMS